MSFSMQGFRMRVDDVAAIFALVPIGRGPKSARVMEAVRAVSAADCSCVFVDDSAAERDEVAAALPKVRVHGADLAARAVLQRDPCLALPDVGPGRCC